MTRRRFVDDCSSQTCRVCVSCCVRVVFVSARLAQCRDHAGWFPLFAALVRGRYRPTCRSMAEC